MTKCVVCGIELVEDYKTIATERVIADDSSGFNIKTSISDGSHCPNCGIKYIWDSYHEKREKA